MQCSLSVAPLGIHVLILQQYMSHSVGYSLGMQLHVIVITRSRDDYGKYNLERTNNAHESYISRKHRV